MKTHIIHLENHDNVVSISDKLSWGKAKRVLLVYPSSGRIILRKIDLLMIQREAQKLGFSIGLVSIPYDLRKLATELDIPFFKSITDAQRRIWKKRNRVKLSIETRKHKDLIKPGFSGKLNKTEVQSNDWIRLSFFSLGVLAVLLLTILFVPSAVIHLNLIDKMQSIQIHVTASEYAKEVNLSGTVPSYKISITVEGNKQLPVTSQTKVPDKPATGLVRFTNLSEDMLLIPTGTIVTQLNNSSIRFETMQRGEILAGIGKTIDLPIHALTSGITGNLEANTIGSVLGDLGIKLTVTNLEATSGGTDRVTMMATEEDRRNLFDKLESQLRLQAIKETQDNLANGDISFDDSIYIEEILKEEYIPAKNQPGEQLSLHLKITYSIKYAEFSDLLKLATPALKSKIPEGFVAVNQIIKIESLEQPVTSTIGITTLDLRLTQGIQREIDPTYLARLVQGATVKEAYDTLIKKYGKDIKPVIEIKPTWWSRLPIAALRIAILN